MGDQASVIDYVAHAGTQDRCNTRDEHFNQAAIVTNNSQNRVKTVEYSVKKICANTLLALVVPALSKKMKLESVTRNANQSEGTACPRH